MRQLSLLYSLCICLLAGVHAFELGVQYAFQYESRVVLSEQQPPEQHQHDAKQTAQVVLRANLSLMRLQFANGLSALRLHFLAATVSNDLGASAPQDLRPSQSEFLLVALEPNSPAWVASLVVPEGEDPFWNNLARGVASILRYRDPHNAPVDSREADTMGECGVAFTWLEGGPQQPQRRLEKKLVDCENVDLAGERNSASALFGVRRSGEATSVFEFSGNELAPPTSVHAREAHELQPEEPRGFGLRILADSSLILAGESPSDQTLSTEAKFETLSAYLQAANVPTNEVALPTALEFERPDSTSSLSQFLTRLPSYLRDSNPSMQALALVQGLPLARGAKNQVELRSQLDLEANKPYLPSILELYAACGTKNCLGALFDFVAKRLADLPDTLLERLLLALAQSSRVGRPVLERTRDLLQRLEAAGKWTAARSAYQALASLARKFSTSGGRPESDVPDLLLARLAGCEEITDAVDAGDCQMAVLSAMANCPSSRYRRPLMRGLLSNASVGSQVTVARLRALQASGPLDVAERHHLAGLLRQRHVPLSDPIRYAIADALGGPAACTEAGVDCRTLRRGADLWLPLRRRYRQPAAGHEEVLAGLTSSAFHRGHLLPTGNASGGVTFELDMLGNRLGGTRLSEFRLAYAHPSAATSASEGVLGVRLYADAIDSLLDSGSGGSPVSGGSTELTEEATAGMQLSVLGEGLRPRRFFTGTSGLMSAVWSAPEEPVGVLQSGFVLHDFTSRVHLHNGLVVQASVTGAASLDVSGSLSVSIWNRNAASKVLNSIGLALHAKAGLRTGRFSVDFVSQAQAELTNTFATFVTFADTPVRTCLAMSNSPIAVNRNCHVTDSLGPRYDHHSHDAFIPGRSFSLGGRNDRLCTELAPDPDDE